MKIKNRHRLKSKDIKNIFSSLQENFSGNFYNEKSSIEIGEVEGLRFIFIDGKPCFMYFNNALIFTLCGLSEFSIKEKYVVVDMGAVKFVTNGADVMSPGIVKADENIQENDQVWICDEKNHKPLAVGIALISGINMKNENKGKAIKIVHYVGDKIWNFVAKSL